MITKAFMVSLYRINKTGETYPNFKRSMKMFTKEMITYPNFTNNGRVTKIVKISLLLQKLTKLLDFLVSRTMSFLKLYFTWSKGYDYIVRIENFGTFLNSSFWDPFTKWCLWIKFEQRYYNLDSRLSGFKIFKINTFERFMYLWANLWAGHECGA